MRICLLLTLVPLALWAQTPAAAPLTLDEAVREAVAHNLDLAAARYNISVAEARQITAALRPNPVLTASADHLDLLGTGYNTINNGGPNEYSLRTDFVLERGRKREARMNLAAAERGLAQLGFEDAMRRLMFDVAGAFVDAQSARENLALAEDNLRTLNGIVEINTVRVRTGDLAGVELERSQVAALQYETAVKQAELRLRQSKTALLLLLGRPGGASLEVTGALRRDQKALALEQVRSSALERRPDLLAVKQAQARTQADLRLQLAQGKIDYTAGVEYRRQQAANAYGNSIGLFFSAPLPVFNRNQGEIARAGRELDQAGAQIRALTARVNNEVDASWQQYDTARTLLESIEETVLAKARSVRERTDYSYRRGEASFVEFLDAQRAFNDVMQSYNDARAGYARSLYLIDAVTAASLP